MLNSGCYSTVANLYAARKLVRLKIANGEVITTVEVHRPTAMHSAYLVRPMLPESRLLMAAVS